MTRTFAALAIAMWTISAAASETTALKPAPDIALVEADGHQVRLSELSGRVVLVDFWASWCIPCRTSFPALDSLYRELGPKGLVVLAVNVDEQRRNADAFLAARPHTMPVAFDPKGNAARAFALQGMPSAVIVDRAGRIRFTHMGYTEKTVAQYRSEVLELLRESE